MPIDRKGKASGKRVARVLEGSWRVQPLPLEMSTENLEPTVPLLLAGGVGALAWRRLQNTEASDSEHCRPLHEAYRLHSLQSAIHSTEIDYVFGALNDAGIDSVLVKGWAAARLYPEAGLRPYGDLDICVRPDQYESARRLIASLDRTRFNVDLHRGFATLDPAEYGELFAGSQLIERNGPAVRVPGAEDQLRILCTHSLRHGLWRPLWLCDIAAALESRPNKFDWQMCFGRDSLTADWVKSTLALAGVLLGVQIEGTPAESRVRTLPRWLISRVLENWSWPDPALHPPQVYSRPMSSYFRDPRGLVRTLRVRWTDPIEATIRMRAPLNGLPRFPFQAGYAAMRLGKFLTGWARTTSRT